MRRALALIWFGVAAQSQAQTQSPDSAVIQALLSEVHQLRIALDRANTIGPRIQMAVERLKLQQESVVRMTRQLEETQRDLAKAQSSREEDLARVKNIESELSQATDLAERKRLEEALKQFQWQAEREQKFEQTFRAQEAELNSRLHSEQATLDGLSDRLNQIERALDAAPVP